MQSINTLRYLFIDSTYRNRKLYPNPSSFEIPFASVLSLSNPADPVVNSTPFLFDVLPAPIVAGVTTTLVLPTPPANAATNAFINMYLQVNLTESRLITAYNSGTGTITFAPFSNGYLAGVDFNLRTSLPIAVGTLVANGTTTTIALPAGIFPQTNNYVRFLTGANASNTLVYWIRSFDMTTSISTIETLPNASAAGDTFELLGLSYESAQTLAYNSSLAAETESSQYRMDLVVLNMPEITTRTPNYGYIDVIGTDENLTNQIPFLYVRLVNTSSGNIHNSQFYSNSPIAQRMTFIVPVSDLNVATPFIRLYRSAMAQVIKFRLTDNLRFEVYTPDGSLFKTEADTFSPYPANPLLQISAVIELSRQEPVLRNGKELKGRFPNIPD